jgi:hypothetical protein
MNLGQITEHEPPGTAKPYFKFDREERQLAAILFHLFQQPKNRKTILTIAGCDGGDWGIKDDQFGIYFDYSYLRDFWNVQLSDASNESKKQFVMKKLRICGATDKLISDVESWSVSNINQVFVGENHYLTEADEESSELSHPDPVRSHTIDLSHHLQSPANWRLPAFAKHIEDPHDLEAVCRLKWAFRVKPDLVIHTDLSHAVCIELKLESPEGSYPSAGNEIAIPKARQLYGEGLAFRSSRQPCKRS